MRLSGIFLILTLTLPAFAQQNLDGRIDRLLRELDALGFRQREAAARELREMGGVAEPALLEALKGPLSAETRYRIYGLLGDLAERYPAPAETTGWYMVGQSIAHAQSFKATGSKVQAMHVRVATPGGLAEAPLVVDLRDATMQRVYARGTIDPKAGEAKFAWRLVEWSHRAPLKRDEIYRIVFHSKDTTKAWNINAVYKQVYPHGDHVGHPLKDNLFFRLSFSDGKSIHVGPDLDAKAVTPINGGAKEVPQNFNIQLQEVRLDFNAGGVPAGELVKN